MMQTTLTILSILFATAAQAWLPPMTWLGGLRLEFLPAVVAFGALTLRRGGAITCAMAAGLAQDALSSAPFGITALAYGVMAWLITTMQDVLDREQPWVAMGAGALCAFAAAFAAWGATGFFAGAIGKVVALTALGAVVTPVVFFGTDALRLMTRKRT